MLVKMHVFWNKVLIFICVFAAAKQTRKADANEAAVEAEVRAAKERAVVPLETRVKQFKEMLREKDVSRIFNVESAPLQCETT